MGGAHKEGCARGGGDPHMLGKEVHGEGCIHA
jgi:hypothetical protein